MPVTAVHAIEVLKEQSFATLGAPWRDLHSRAEGRNVFLSHEWLSLWWSAYRPEAELHLLVARRDGTIFGVAPLMIRRETHCYVPLRVLRFVGDGTWETDHMNFVVDAHQREATLHALLDAIRDLPWDVAVFNQMPEKSVNTAQTIEHAVSHGWRVRSNDLPCPIRDFPATFDALMASMPPRLRTSVRSSRRKLAERFRVEFGLHDDAEQFDDALRTFFENHASRWRAKGQGGVFVDACKRDFYERLTHALHARGWLRFFYLKLDDRIVAQEYCFACDGTVMLLQEGFDNDYAHYNVGNVLRSRIFEHLIETGASAYDFLAGTSRHKRAWADREASDLRVTIVRPTLGGCAFSAMSRLAQWVKATKRTTTSTRHALGGSTVESGY